MPCRLFMAASFEIAQNQRDTEPFRQPLDFFVKHACEIIVHLDACFLSQCRRAPFVPLPPGRDQSSTRCGAIGNLVQPGTQGIAHPEPPGLLYQDQKRRLKRILGVVRIDQNGPAHTQDHRPVSLDQGRERQLGGFALAGRKPLQELAIGQLADRPDIKKRAKLPDDSPVLADRHE